MTVRWALSIIVGFSAIISDHPVAAVRGAQPSAARRPNILLAVADDWSFPHASVYGDPTVFLYFYRLLPRAV